MIQAAGIAKSTFYLHLQDLAALDTEVAETLLSENRPTDCSQHGFAVRDPLTRIATALAFLLRDLSSRTEPGADFTAPADHHHPRGLAPRRIQARPARGPGRGADRPTFLAISSLNLARPASSWRSSSRRPGFFGAHRINRSSIPDLRPLAVLRR